MSMVKMKIRIFRLFPTVLIMVYIVYLTWSLIKETYCCLPITVLLINLMVLGIHYFRIPPPDAREVVTVLGKDVFIEDDTAECVTKVVAHRGAGLDAPENSLAAFKLCKEQGCDFVEFDVSITSDGVPIIFHDRNLKRMAGLDLVINETTWEQLSTIDISVNHPLKDRYPNTNIPTLEEAVLQILACGQRMFIDIKESNRKIVSAILDIFDKYPELKSRSVVTSFYPNVIYLIRKTNPGIVCCLAWKRDGFGQAECSEKIGPDFLYKFCILRLCDMFHEWSLPRITYYLLGISIVLLHKDSLSGEAIINWRKKGIRVVTWTVNCPIEKKYIGEFLKITYLTDTLVTADNDIEE